MRRPGSRRKANRFCCVTGNAGAKIICVVASIGPSTKQVAIRQRLATLSPASAYANTSNNIWQASRKVVDSQETIVGHPGFGNGILTNRRNLTLSVCISKHPTVNLITRMNALMFFFFLILFH